VLKLFFFTLRAFRKRVKMDKTVISTLIISKGDRVKLVTYDGDNICGGGDRDRMGWQWGCKFIRVSIFKA